MPSKSSKKRELENYLSVCRPWLVSQTVAREEKVYFVFEGPFSFSTTYRIFSAFGFRPVRQFLKYTAKPIAQIAKLVRDRCKPVVNMDYLRSVRFKSDSA